MDIRGVAGDATADAGAGGSVGSGAPPDGGSLNRAAAQLAALAAEARAGAVRVAQVDAVEWRSLAAERFRAVLREEAQQVRRCAELLEGAAHAVAVHARAVAGELGQVPR